MVQYRAADINTGELVTGWLVRAEELGEDDLTYVIIEDKTHMDGIGEFWWMDCHRVDPTTIEKIEVEEIVDKIKDCTVCGCPYVGASCPNCGSKVYDDSSGGD